MRKRKTDRIPFTKEELDMIENTELCNLKDLAVFMKRDYDSLRRKKWTMENWVQDRLKKNAYKRRVAKEIPAPNTHQVWSPAEEDLILTSSLTDKELALELGRSVGSIQVKRARLLQSKKRK